MFEAYYIGLSRKRLEIETRSVTIEHLGIAVTAYGESNGHMTDDVSEVLIMTSVCLGAK